MTKTFTVTIDSVKSDGFLSISSHQNGDKNVTVSLGIHSIILNGGELKDALEAVKDFNTISSTIEPTPIGSSSMGWTK